MTEPTTAPGGPTSPRPGARPVAAAEGPTLETAAGGEAVLNCPACGASFPAGRAGSCPVCAGGDPNEGGSPSPADPNR